MSEVIGWIGVGLGMCISLPQVIKTLKTKSTVGVSRATYIILFFAVLCYLFRAIAIKEAIFIASNLANLGMAITMLYLFKRYPN